MIRNKEGGATKYVDWYQELLKAIFTWTIGRILNLLMKLMSRRLLINKRPLLTFVGLAYVGGIMFTFLVWLAGTYTTAKGPYTIATITGYVVTTFGLLIATGISGLGLNRLAHCIDPSHWTARMTAGMEPKKRTRNLVRATPSYIQQLSQIQLFDD